MADNQENANIPPSEKPTPAPPPLPKDFRKEKIVFDQRRQADCLIVPEDANAARIVEQMTFRNGFPEAVMMVIGGADGLDADNPRLAQFFNRGISRAAMSTNAVVIDGGTDSGVPRLMGRAVADRTRRPDLIGIAPYGKIDYPGKKKNAGGETPLEKHHSAFVLVESDQWGDETEVMFRLAEELSLNMPIMTVLINGGEIAKEEALRNVRKGWPLLVVEGSGRLADEIARLFRKPPDFIEDPVMAEIIADGKIDLISLKESKEATIEQTISHLIGKVKQILILDDTLESAWLRFASYDQNATRQKRNFVRRQNLILILGVVATLVALVQATIDRYVLQNKADYPGVATILEDRKGLSTYDAFWDWWELEELPPEKLKVPNQRQQMRMVEPALQDSLVFAQSDSALIHNNRILAASKLVPQLDEGTAHHIASKILFFERVDDNLLRPLVVFIPILLTALVAISNRFKSGNKWIMLRATAEELKRSIFLYRARAGAFYKEELNKVQETLPTMLALRIKAITHPAMKTEINMSSIREYTGPIPPDMDEASGADDGFSQLNAEKYLKIRLGDQLTYYQDRADSLETRLYVLQMLIILLGAMGTLIAFMGFEIWIALTGALAGAFATLMEYQQVETTLVRYNQVKTDLLNLQVWWQSLNERQKRLPANFNALVVNTERTLENALSGWVQNMKDALDELREKQSSDEQAENFKRNLAEQREKSQKGNVIEQMRREAAAYESESSSGSTRKKTGRRRAAAKKPSENPPAGAAATDPKNDVDSDD